MAQHETLKIDIPKYETDDDGNWLIAPIHSMAYEYNSLTDSWENHVSF